MGTNPKKKPKAEPKKTRPQRRRKERTKKTKKPKKTRKKKTTKQQDNKWEDGIIYLFEEYLKERFPIGPMYARGMATSIVSSCLGGIQLQDKMGLVKPNTFFVYIAPSGMFKTPPLKVVRDFFRTYMKRLLGLSKFTQEFFTKWMSNREPPYCIIIRDEITRLAIEKGQKHFTAFWEYLSELWDGFIESYGTIARGYEGDIDAYVCLLTAGTERFLQLVDEDFWIQGLGNRFLWIIEDPVKPTRLDPWDFFVKGGGTDTESVNLFKNTRKAMKRIEKLRHVTITKKAADMWCDYEFDVRNRIFEEYNRMGISYDERYEAKQPLNALKLAICYASSRMNVDPSMKKLLIVSGEDMGRAIEDTRVYINMWFKAFDMWKKGPKVSRDKRLDTSLQDLESVLRGSVSEYSRLVTAEIGQEILGTSSKNKVIGILSLGVAKRQLKQLNTYNSEDGLTKKQIKYIRKRSSRGPLPIVYKVVKRKKKRDSK